MQMNYRTIRSLFTRRSLGAWRTCLAVVLAFAAGSALTARYMHLNEVRAESDRVFELNIYHAVPGKVPALETRFRSAAKLFAKHDMNVVGYWVPQNDPAWANNPAWANTFVYIVAHPNWDDATKRWDAFHSDPEFDVYKKSEEAVKLIERVDKVHMRPTDYSPMK